MRTMKDRLRRENEELRAKLAADHLENIELRRRLAESLAPRDGLACELAPPDVKVGVDPLGRNPEDILAALMAENARLKATAERNQAEVAELEGRSRAIPG